jgi:hypothetical protein
MKGILLALEFQQCVCEVSAPDCQFAAGAASKESSNARTTPC